MKRLHRFAITATITVLIFGTTMSQNVGIGLTNPDHKLTIQSTNASTLRLIGPGGYGSEARFTFGDLDNCYIEEDIDDNLKIFGYYRTAIMGGYVGIGTIDPEEKLHVEGTIRSSGQIQSFNTDYGLVHSNNGLTVGTYINGTSAQFGTQTNHPVTFFTNGNTAAPSLVIQNGTGNVGIGTTNPISRLDVVGGGIRCESSPYGFLHTDATTSMGTYVDGFAGWLGTFSGHPLWFFTGGSPSSPSMVIENDGPGNVGIGLTDPDHKLTIESTNSSVLRLMGPGTYWSQARLTFGDADRAFIEEDIDDKLTIFGWDRIALMGGNVGIGTATPEEKLHVEGTIKVTGEIQSDAFLYGLVHSSGDVSMCTYVDETSGQLGTISNHPLWFFTGNDADPSMVIQNTTGLVGIRKTVPEADLHIKQSASSSTRGIILEYADNANDWRMQIDNDNDFSIWYNGILKTWFWDTDGSFHMASDRRLKKDIVMMESTLSKVMSLEPATYHYIDAENADTPKSIGFMAQDVQELFPDLVSEKNGYLGLNYVGFIPVAIKAIQEQQTIIDVQEKRIAKLEAIVAELLTKGEQPVQPGQ